MQTGPLVETAEASQSIDNPVAVRKERSFAGKGTGIPTSQTSPESIGTMIWMSVPTPLGDGSTS
jgi:hypothetical protein